nr:P27 family phage terminase small subunit [Staphylococcus sp. GDY8P131P]
MVENKDKIKTYLLNRIEKDNPVQTEKVYRYLNLLDIFYGLDADIEEKGLMVETKNASQSFVKPNPLIAEKNKVNTSLLAIEKSFGFNKEQDEETAPRRDLL